MEAEYIISSIHEFPIQEIGSSSFLKMFCFEIEKLSLQAHASASNASWKDNNGKGDSLSVSEAGIGGEDEYVIDLLLTHNKVTPLVQTLLAIEAWRTFVLCSKQFKEPFDDEFYNDEKVSDKSSLMEIVAKQGNSLRVAFTLHAETTIVSLLTLMFYRRENVMEIETSILLSIVDYCARQMVS